MRFQLVLIKPEGVAPAEALGIPMEMTATALRRLGHEVFIRTNRIESGWLTILFGAHRLSHDDAARVPHDSIIFNFEPLAEGYRWFSSPFLRLLRRHRVWDANLASVEYLRRSGIAPTAMHVPLTVVPVQGDGRVVVGTPREPGFDALPGIEHAIAALPPAPHDMDPNAAPGGTNAGLLADSVSGDWWYYDVELKPGVIVKGQYPPGFPMLPRMMLRRCAIAGAHCLDIGSMEGLMPVLMAKQGAARVIATDAVAHCEKKMGVLKQLHGVDFEFRAVGLMYDLAAKLGDCGGFDLINLSGVLYHVFSPMHVLAGLRPLLRRGGMMIVSTNVVLDEAPVMLFNAQGRLQTEANTFWYLSVPLLEHLIRYFALEPLDVLYFPHSPLVPTLYSPARRSGYISVLCRAVDPGKTGDDAWTAHSQTASWEFLTLCNREMMAGQPESRIGLRNTSAATAFASGELAQRLDDPGHRVEQAARSEDTHLLRLADSE